METPKINRLNIALAAISGLLLTGSFPKVGISWLAWFALVPLLFSIRDLSIKDSFYVGFLAGFVHYLSLLYWLVYTMRTYGNLPLTLSVIILLLLSTYLALYVAAFSMTLTRAGKNPFMCTFLIPFLWISLEYVRSFLLTGFPWELMGYSQYKILHIIQISDILGVYGVSFLIAISNTAFFLAVLCLAGKKWQGIAVPRGLLAGLIIAAALISVLVWGYGKRRIQSVDEATAALPSKRITIVQGNIDQAKKWNPAFQEETTKKYIELSQLSKDQVTDLVVWPETATPFYFLDNAGFSEMVKKGIRRAGTDFLIGSPSFTRRDNVEAYYNSALLVGPDGRVYGKYDKVHLVPFGEYVPLKPWLPFLGKMVAEVGDFRSGTKGHTILWGNYRIGLQICYEIIFPSLSRAMVGNGAALLVNITNDAWFGRTSAPIQHFSMAVFRAVENRRALVRSANTGISGMIDPAGRIIAKTPLFQEKVLTRDMPMMHQTTFYSRFGDLFAMACTAVSLFVVVMGFLRNLSNERRKRCLMK